MKNHSKPNTQAAKASMLKARIARNRTRAELIGLLYLVATIVLAVAACSPLMIHKLAPIGISQFWRQFLPANLKAAKNLEWVIRMVNSTLYAAMLIGLVVNTIRAFAKLGWLFKKKASKTYGFNRNAYAMEDIGNLFSGSFALILITYFIIALFCGNVALSSFRIRFGLLIVGALFIHFFCGIIGGKISYFDLEDGDIVEEERVIGRFAPVLRNVIQLVVVFAMIILFLDVCKLHTVISPLLEKGGIRKYLLNQPTAWISLVLQGLTILCLFVLIKHATGITEFNINGPYGSGMKNFRVFSFFIFLTSGATFACRYLFKEVAFKMTSTGRVSELVQILDVRSIIIAGIALAVFIIEVVMRHMPAIPAENDDTEVTYKQKEPPVVSNVPVKPDPQNPSSLYVNVAPVMVLDGETKTQTPPSPVVAPTKTEEPTPTMSEVHEVSCPTCKKALRVNSASPYHRCPCCGNVFKIRKVKKTVII